MMQVVLDPITNSQDAPVRLSTRRRVTREEYRAFCDLNRDWRIERSAEGELILRPPAYSRSGAQNANLTMQLGVWAIQDGTGISFDSSAGFDLPDGSNRSPDAAWILNSRLQALRPEQREEYFEICPDFVLELRSTSDRIPDLQAKMRGYMDCGAQLGWLIDPLERRVWVYQPGCEVELVIEPATLVAGRPMPGFVLDLKRIWNPQI